MAALVEPGHPTDIDGSFCGATVIAPYAFLTAAHCIIQDTRTLTPAQLIVVTGKTDLSQPGGQHLAVRKMVTHPGFAAPTALSNDIAVVLTTSPTTSAAVIRDSLTPTGGTTGTALGWGATDVAPNAPATYPPLLQEAALPIVTPDNCKSPGVICVGDISLTPHNICIGDSGGPLLVTRDGVTRQAGIASAIIAASQTSPFCGTDFGEFMDVSHYNAWIDAQLAPAVSGVAVSALAGGKLRVTWQRTPGGAEPSVAVSTSDGSVYAVPAGVTSLDIAGMPLGRALRATVTVTNAWGTATATSAGTAVLVTRPVVTVKPRVRGAARVGRTLTCLHGTWKATPAPSYAYAWRIGGKVSKSQKKATLKLTKAMRGKSVSCAVTAKNPVAAVTARSAAVTVRRR
jgi:secreted trypsin-like serine protease